MIKFYHKDQSGLGLMEIILALAIMTIITPVVLRFSFRELYEVKYINTAKQLKMIEKAMMNYAAIEKEKWANGSNGGLNKDVYKTLVDNYGLNEDTPEELTNNMIIKYIKDAQGAVNVFAVIYMDYLGLDEMGFKQTLLYAGDTAGYKEDNYAYSITGAWSEPFANIASNVSGDFIAVIKIDDTNLENEYASSNYLYRNNQGGKDGNTMLVNLSLGGYSINNFGTINTSNLKSSVQKDGFVSELKFNNGNLEGKLNIDNSIILKGVFSFASDAYIMTDLLKITSYSNGALSGSSVLDDFLTPNALLENSSLSLSSFRANVIVEGIAKLSNLLTRNMQISSLDGYNNYNTNLNIEPLTLDSDPTNLRMEISASDVNNLSAHTLTVKDGHIVNQDNSFNTNAGRINVPAGASVVIYDACHTPGNCDGKILNKVNLTTFATGFTSALNDLESKINNLIIP